jgi:hypothetical protein
VDQAHRILTWKINPKFDYSRNFAKMPLSFFEIKTHSTKISRRPLATSRIYK